VRRRATALVAALLLAGLVLLAAALRFGPTLAFTLALAAPATEAWRAPFVQTVAREEIAFSGGGVEYTGRVNGNTMSGTARPGGSWTATRAGR